MSDIIQLSNNLINEIINMDKTINSKLNWIDENAWWKIKVNIENEKSYNLILIITKSKITKDYTFNILYNNERILGFCPYKKHPDPKTGKKISKHKHKWDEIIKDKNIYVPSEIQELNIKNAFQDFLKEFNIKYDNSLPNTPPVQLKLD